MHSSITSTTWVDHAHKQQNHTRYTVSMFWAWAIVVVVSIFFLFRRTPSTKGKKFKQVRPPVETVIANKKDAPYEISELHAPLLTGRLLKFVIGLAFSPAGRWLVVNPSVKKSNNNVMGGEYIPERPLFDAIPPPRKSGHAHHDDVNTQVLSTASPPSATPTSGFRYNTILDYHHCYKSKTLTPTDIARAVLKAMDHSNKTTPPLLAVLEWDESVVMAMAEASTNRWERNAPLSLLDGVPVAVKGEIVQEPYSLMAGAKFKASCCENMVEGELMKRLKEAGAVLVGVTNMQEFGTGTLGSNPGAGTPRNPHNPAHYCGGSSSGSAASVAAGLCPLAIGADGGGSVRIPASLCGVAGLKPTSKLLPSQRAGVQLAYAVGVVGPLASSFTDVAIAMDVFLKGSGSPFSLEGFGSKSLSGLKVGVYWRFFHHCDREVASICEAAVRLMESLGAEINEITIPELEELRAAHMCMIVSEMNTNLATDVDKHFDAFNPETLLVLAMAQGMSSHEYINSLKQRARGVRIMEDVFSQVDLVVTPTCSIPAPLIHPGSASHGVSDATASGRLMRFMFLANITGLPAVSVPVATNGAGLPIGLQVIAPWHEDGLLLRVGHALEGAGPGTERPQVYYDLLSDT